MAGNPGREHLVVWEATRKEVLDTRAGCMLGGGTYWWKDQDES